MPQELNPYSDLPFVYQFVQFDRGRKGDESDYCWRGMVKVIDAWLGPPLVCTLR